MPFSVPLVNGGIFTFAEMRFFSPFGLYLREMVKRVHSSASRYSVNRVRITEKHFAVWRLLHNMPAKSLRFLAVLVVPKMGTTTLGHEARLQYNEVTGLNAAYVRTAVQACHPSGASLGTYVRSESPENADIFRCPSASIPKKPRTRRPAALVTLLQYSRLYLPWLAITASLKLRGFIVVRLFSAQ